MSYQHRPVQFGLNKAQLEVLMSHAKEGESPGLCAKRLLLALLEPKLKKKRVRLIEHDKETPEMRLLRAVFGQTPEGDEPEEQE